LRRVLLRCLLSSCLLRRFLLLWCFLLRRVLLWRVLLWRVLLWCFRLLVGRLPAISGTIRRSVADDGELGTDLDRLVLTDDDLGEHAGGG
jgi:hypothetical protein